MTDHDFQLDPRGIITPDAFEVSTSLLGLPLATPGRRFVALMIDLAVIGFVTLVTKSFALVLGVVAAFLFIRASLKRTEVRGSVFGRAMRLSLGCLGVFIGVVTAIVWAAVGFSGGGARVEVNPGDGSGRERTAASLGLSQIVSGFTDFEALRRADTEEEAAASARELAGLLLAAGMTRREAEELLLEAIPADAPWADDAPDLLAEALDRAAADRADPEGAAPPTPAPDDAGAPVSALSVAEALDEYAVLVRAGTTDPADLARMAALRGRLRVEVAGDTLAALEERLDEMERLAERRQDEVRELRDRLEEEASGGLFAWLREFVDELGFGFGWASLYLTVTLSWWNGLTVGKKIMGIRVVRLDGEPITWWVAFERAGGYAAGFATGLLGFAQVYWDANRQAIHDRIVGTVVVVDGAEPVVGWEEAVT